MTEKVIAPIHPGRILKEEFLEPMGLTAGQLALACGVPAPRIYDVVAGKRGITLDTALRLSRYFGTSHQMWLGLQSLYELHCAEDAGVIDKIEREVVPREQTA